MLRARCLLASAVLAASPAALLAQNTVDPIYQPMNHGSGFGLPTGIEFLGTSPTDYFVIEKNSGLVKRHLDGATTTVLDLPVANQSERGLLGIARDPDFASNGHVFLYYSATSGSDGGAWTQNQLSRFTWNGTTLGSETMLRTFGTSTDGQAMGANHDGGPMVFGPDGKLYGITGDLNRSGPEQNVTWALQSARTGGVYRLNPDGSVPSDNPFTAAADTGLHAWHGYGIRNSFGINFDPLTDALWQTENGPESYDEINRIDPGFNGGWLHIMGPDSRDAQGMGDLLHLAGSTYSDPEFSWVSTVAPTGISFLANSTMDLTYRDAVVVGDNNFGQLYLYRLNANRDGFVLSGGLSDLVADSAAERDAVHFGTLFSSMTELTIGPDGGLYVVSIITGNVWRIGGKSWKTDANGTWETAGNWQGGAPAAAGEIASFFQTISAPRTVTYTSAKTIGSMLFNSPHRYTITGAPAFSFTSGSAAATNLRVMQGSHTIDVPVSVLSPLNIDIFPADSVMTITGKMTADGVTITKGGAGTFETAALSRSAALPASTPSLIINAGTFRIMENGTSSGTSAFGQLTITAGQLDLTDNRAVLTNTPIGAWNGSSYNGVTRMIANGRSGGDWDGSGVVTSMADAQTGLTTIAVATAQQALKILPSQTAVWSGQTVSGGNTLLMYTYTGDANLSGHIDADDYFQIDSNYGDPSNAVRSYFNGDFNYSGTIDGDDYFLIDASFLAQGPPLLLGGAGAISAVPEPVYGVICSLVVGSGLIPRRRLGFKPL